MSLTTHRPDTPEEEIIYRQNLGKVVFKKTRKPFKSHLLMGTVRGFIMHPTTGRLCYLFMEDDSYVECCRCQPRKVQTHGEV